MTVKNGNYKKVLDDLTKAGVTENQFSWFSLMVGVLAKGVEPGSRIFISVFSNLLNDGQPLPGALVATLTNLAMDTKEKLENADQDLFAMPDDSYEKQDRLKTLADLSYGLSLGLTVNAKDGSLEKISDREVLGDLNTISEVAKVDVEAELDEDDLDIHDQQRILYSNDRGTVMNLLCATDAYASGLGIVNSFVKDQIVLIPLQNSPKHTLGYVTNRKKKLSDIGASFINEIKLSLKEFSDKSQLF